MEAFSTFKEHFGAVFRNPNRRDAYLLAVDNAVSSVYRDLPQDKIAWRLVLANVRTVLREVVTVSLSAKVAESLDEKLVTSFVEGTLDFESLILRAEVGHDDEPKSQALPDVQNKVLQAQVAALSARVAQAEGETAQRARGRGYFRGFSRRSRGRGRGQE